MLYSTVIWLLLIILGLIIVFYCICILCDEHLVPTIEVFIEQFRIPEEVAAVTLVAFGSACPEIVLNSIGAMENKSSLSLPACLGSGIIAFGLIPSLCVLLNDKPVVILKSWPVFRESFFYCCALIIFLRSFRDKSISLGEAALLVSVYLFYVSLVVGLYLFDSGDRPGILTSSPHPVVPVPGRAGYAEVNSDVDMEEEEEEESAGGDGEAPEQQALLFLGTSPSMPLVSPAVGNGKPWQPQEASEYDDSSDWKRDEGGEEVESGLELGLGNEAERGDADSGSSRVYQCLLPYCHHSIIRLLVLPVLDALDRGHRSLDSAIGQPLHTLLNMMVPALRPHMANSSCSLWCGQKYAGTDTDSQSVFGANARPASPRSPRSPHSPRTVIDAPPVSLTRALLVFAVCIAGIGVLASLIISLCEGVTAILGVDSGTIGATMVALGSEVGC